MQTTLEGSPKQVVDWGKLSLQIIQSTTGVRLGSVPLGWTSPLNRRREVMQNAAQISVKSPWFT